MSDFHSGWSQGKGSRRQPGRQGGLGKRRRVSWEHQTKHEVRSAAELERPLAYVEYITEWGKKPVDAVYIFDQEAAKRGLRYFIDCGTGSQKYGFRLRILVSKRQEKAAQEIVGLLRPKPNRRKNPLTVTGHWRPILLQDPRFKNIDWRFATYHESSYERTDGQSYEAFVFRNKQKTIWGIQEFLGESPLKRIQEWQRLAERVIEDEGFRQSLISDDPDLPEMWRKR